MNKRIERLESVGYTEWVDSGYADSKVDYQRTIAKYEELGKKVVRVKSDTRGLIMYVVLAKKED